MSKQISLTLDDSSIEILTEVDSIHRDSLVNIGLQLVKKTGYYKTLSGKQKSEELEDIASLDTQDEDRDEGDKKKNKSNKSSKQPKQSSAPSWDAF